MNITAFDLAQRFIGLKEVKGVVHNPQIMAMLRLDVSWPDSDEVPWCSAFVNYIAWLLRLPRSKSLRARSWLEVGRAIPIEEMQAGFDVVVFRRRLGDPGPDVLNYAGHVGFAAGAWQRNDTQMYVLGGNQADTVSMALYPIEKILGIRRLYDGNHYEWPR